MIQTKRLPRKNETGEKIERGQKCSLPLSAGSAVKSRSVLEEKKPQINKNQPERDLHNRPRLRVCACVSAWKFVFGSQSVNLNLLICVS